MSMMIRRHRRGDAPVVSPVPKKPEVKPVEEEKQATAPVKRGRPKKEQ